MPLERALVLARKYETLLNKYGVNTPLRKAHFFAQAYHESGLEAKSENLNYSAKRLREVFSKYFTSKQANQYTGKPQAIANRVYANRMGNGDENSGDGYKYRGRGFFQITGKNNYKEMSKDTGVDFVTNPDLVLTEADSMISALWYWNERNLSRYADQDDVDAVSDIVNIGKQTKAEGDAHGYTQRYNYTQQLKKLFK
jgi:putative chitinase